ncbi:cyclin-D3-2-like [Canna indica]|uniref:Cyclin-D3-2-like n=1 Tax=Canna indica TaxID=4628 RepID=A0AAQ3KWK5_9LILI|nr:cyclin-D3-2-like [Canna indica]
MALLDTLYCPEESLELEEDRTGPMSPALGELETECHLVHLVAEEEWAGVLCSLAAKEGDTCTELLLEAGGEHAYLISARREAVEWVTRAAARHAFSVLTALLAVNYMDRCFLHCPGGGGLRLQRDKPWMGRLAAVACLSLAAKVEETAVPLLLDLQVSSAPESEENKYVFDAKTVRRMELLVLSALGWRMNPVTPLSFIHHLLTRLCSGTAGGGARIRELASLCEALLLPVVADWRWVRYPASAWAAAALLQATEGGGGAAAPVESHEIDHLISFLDVPKEKVEECSQIIAESLVYGGKRKHSFSFLFYNYGSPPSPNRVIGSCFSCESSSSSGDSLSTWPNSVSSSPETRPCKKPNCTSVSKGSMEDAVLFAS